MTSGLAAAEAVVRGIAANTTLGNLTLPVAAGDASGGAELRGYGVTSGDPIFVPGWRFRWGANASPVLRAFAHGSLRFEAGVAGSPDKLVLRFGEPLGRFLRQRDFMSWFPVPDRAVYEGVDPDATRAQLVALLEADAKLLASTRAVAGLELDAGPLVDRFLAGQLPNGISVRAGHGVGVPAEQGGARELLFRLSVAGLPEGHSLDPSIYVQHWARYFTDLEGHPFEAELRRPFGGPVQNGTVRYVDPLGIGDAPFTDRDAPGHDLRAVLDACEPGDTIVLVATEPFVLPKQLVVDKAVTLTSFASVDVTQEPEPSDAELEELPELRADGGRVLWVPATQLGDGIATIANVRIRKGHGDNDADGGSGSEGYIRGGGGILVTGKLTGATFGPDYDYDAPTRVYVRNCLIAENETPKNTSTVDGDAERNSAFGGGVLCKLSSPYLFGNRVRENFTSRRGGGIAVLGFGWPRIEANVIHDNLAGDGGGIGLEVAFPDDQGWDALGNIDPAVVFDMGNAWHDGSIAKAQSRQVELVRNIIRDNVGYDDGGGVYASVVSRFLMLDCDVRDNRAAVGGGGGVRITYGSAGEIRRGSITGNTSNSEGDPFGTERSKVGGGAIAVRNSDLSVHDVRIEDNEATGFAGGAIYFAVTSSGHINWIGDLVDVDYDDILEEAFGNERFTLRITGATEIRGNRCLRIPTDPDHRKGGGVYVARISEEMVDDIGYEPRELELLVEGTVTFAENELVLNPAIAGDALAAPGSAAFHLADFVHDVTTDDAGLLHDGERITLLHVSE